MNNTEYGYTSRYLTKNGEPWFPIMGEIHYSRYPKEYWKESIYKMRAGGVEVVSAYVIWIHHEEIETEYDFTGNRNLREFLEACKECNMKLLLRVGPWVHGEVRNGGFPDWLLKKEYPTRCNDERYLAVVKKYYGKIFEQAKGYLLSDGGPIIGLQIENEYGHVGGLQGEEGEQHMRNLLAIAKEVGFELPIYTATGWGGAVTGGMIPVMGGYCDAPWDARLTELPPSGNYVFTRERNDHNIGSDHGFGYGITFDMDKFPYLTAELGGGLQVTHHRRPVAHSKDIGAMTMTKLGCGVNLLGYYMYHGGTNPKGKLTTLQESKETGYPNDLPVMNYDFRAPIREYGQVSETHKEIKLIASFLHDFGSELCTMPAVLPKENPVVPTNLTDVRIAFRHNGKKGYVFINNYQRRYEMAEHTDYVIRVPLKEETVTFPAITIKDKEFFFYPVNMEIGNAVLKTALATPFCKLENPEETTYVFYADHAPEYQLEGELGNAKLLTLSREDAKNAYKIVRDREYLIISESTVVDEDDKLVLFGRKAPVMRVYPAFAKTPEGFVQEPDQDGFAVYTKKESAGRLEVETKLKKKTEETAVYTIRMERDAQEEDSKDVYLILNYGGDTAKLKINGELEADHYYTGDKWEISMRRFQFPETAELEITALREDEGRFLETWPVMTEGKACEVIEAELVEEFQTKVEL